MIITTILLILGGLIAAYLLVLAGVAWFSIRPPRMPQFVTPGLMGEAHETVSITTTDGHTLRAWWVPGESDTTIIFAHGYFTNRCEYVPFVTRFKDRGASCLFFDHRAHGTSTGKRCTFGIEEAMDVQAAVDWLKAKRPNDKVVLVGNSMGAVACAIKCAAIPTDVDAIVLDSPYATVSEGAKGWWTFFAHGKFKGFLQPCSMYGRIFSGADLKSVNLAAALTKIRTIPVLMLFASKDPLISKQVQDECVEAAGSLGEVVWFHKSNHARARFHEPDLYTESVFDFLTRHGFISNSSPIGSAVVEPVTINSGTL